MLDARLVARLGAFHLDVALAAERGTTLVLVGESGAGKTTVLRLLAGLARPASGRIALGDCVLFDGTRAIDVPASLRPVGFLAQDYALFPHLTVRDNVAFGLRAQGMPRRDADARAAAALARLGVSELADRVPSKLSGGQQQRAALARALVLEPELLLLDEPLSALDLVTRRAVRTELRRLLAGLPCVTVYVTHSPLEAMAFGDRIAVIEAGRVVQSGPRDDLLRHPRTPYVAELMGVNLFRGTRAIGPPADGARLATGAGEIAIGAAGGGSGDELFAAVSPREIALHLERPAGSARNVFHGRITELVPEPPLGERYRVALDTRPPLVAEVTAEAVRAMSLAPGREVFASFKATGVTTYA